jgi:hypothetical protein
VARAITTAIDTALDTASAAYGRVEESIRGRRAAMARTRAVEAARQLAQAGLFERRAPRDDPRRRDPISTHDALRSAAPHVLGVDVRLVAALRVTTR